MSQEWAADWLDDNGSAARAAQQAKAVDFAQNYLVFEQDSRARALLEHWEQAVLRKRTPVDATHQRYAADEAVRAFVAGIREQISLARQAKQ